MLYCASAYFLMAILVQISVRCTRECGFVGIVYMYGRLFKPSFLFYNTTQQVYMSELLISK